MIGPVLSQFQHMHTAITIDLSISNYHLNLQLRDSDVAIRPTRTPPQGFSCYRIGDVEFRMYSNSSRLDNLSADDLPQDCWLGLSAPLLSAPVGQWFSKAIEPERIRMQSESFLALKVAAEQGLDVAELPCALAA